MKQETTREKARNTQRNRSDSGVLWFYLTVVNGSFSVKVFSYPFVLTV